MKNNFDYLIEKLEASAIESQPFEHIIIDDFLSTEHFLQVIESKEINIQSDTTEKLIEQLEAQDYKAQIFPGCTTNVHEYLTFLGNRENNSLKKPTTEGQGMTFRLKEKKSQILQDLDVFFNSIEFTKAIKKKFDIKEKVRVESGLQKYLDGYEISPHPDIRLKAATFMLNLNNSNNSEEQDIHTYLLKFKPEYKYIHEFWKNNKEIDRSWVPWHWCDTVKKTTRNNSIIFFSPNNHSLHAVRLKYDHLKFQRTQYYGNLWYTKEQVKYNADYEVLENLDLKRVSKVEKMKLRQKIKNFINPGI